MTLKEFKKAAEEFRKVADDKAAVEQLADDTRNAHSGDTDVSDFCRRYHTAAGDPAHVRAISDEWKAKKD